MSGQRAKRQTSRWPVLVICCVQTMASQGLAYGLSAVFTDLKDAFNTTHALAGLVQSLCVGLLFGMGVVTGPVIQRCGPRVSMVLGSLLSTAGCLLAFFATDIVVVIVGMGALVGAGVSFGYLTPLAMAGILFYDVRNIALPAIFISGAAGSALYPFLLRYLVHTYALRGTFLIVAGINFQTLVLGVLMGFYTSGRRQEAGGGAEDKETGQQEGADVVSKQCIDQQDPQTDHLVPEACRETAVERCKTGESKLEGKGCCDAVVYFSDISEEETLIAIMEDDLPGDLKRKNTNDKSLAIGPDAVINCPQSQNHNDAVCQEEIAENVDVFPASADTKTQQDASCEKSPVVVKNCSGSQSEKLEEVVEDGESSAMLNQTKDNSSRHRNPGQQQAGNTSSTLSLNGSSRRGLQPARREHQPGKPSSWASCLQLEVFRDARYVAAIVAATDLLTVLSPSIFMTEMVREQGMSVEAGSLCLFVMHACNIAGRVSTGVLAHFVKVNICVVFAVSNMCLGLACLAFAFTATYSQYVATSGFYGVCFGVFATSLGLCALEILGPAHFAVGSGYLICTTGVFICMCGPLGGSIREKTGDFDAMFYTAFAHGLLSGCLLLVVFLRFSYFNKK